MTQALLLLVRGVVVIDQLLDHLVFVGQLVQRHADFLKALFDELLVKS